MKSYKREVARLLVLTIALAVVLAAKGREMIGEPRIIDLGQRKLVGMSQEMSRINDKTGQLWRGFMERRQEIAGRVSQNFVSMQVYPRGPRQLAEPSATFTKWAVVEVESLESIPQGMQSYVLQPGTYAVFDHHGPASDVSTFVHIFNEWLPNSRTYALDDREHFEVLPPDYDAQDPNAREEIWIPIKSKE
jgi:AraC family transcriptional regulator